MAHHFWPDTMQVNVYGHDERNGMLLNVFHVLAPGTVTGTDTDAVAAAVSAWVTTDYKQIWAESISSDRVVVTDVSTLDSVQSEVPASASGTLVGAPVPSEVTLAVKKSTGLSGRRHRGDWYCWPATTAQLELLDSNLWQATHAGNCVAHLENLRTALSTAGYTLVVASQAGGTVQEVKHFVLTDRLVDSQRRRGGNRGR